MRRPLAKLALLTLGLAFAPLLGCDKWTIRTETRIDRAARMTRVTRIEYVGSKKDDPGDHIGDRFRVAEGVSVEGRGPNSLILSLSARSPEDFAPDLVVKAEKGRRDPANRITWEKRDGVVLDHWVYREALSDSVDEAERDAAIEDVYGVFREIALELARAEAGERYGLEKLERYLDGPVRRLIHDLMRRAVTTKDHDELERIVAQRLGAFGIAASESLQSKETSEALLRFCTDKLEELLEPRPGVAPFDASPLLVRDAEDKPLLGQRIEEASAAAYGSTEAAEEAFKTALTGVLGDMRDHDMEFEARVVLPGRLIRSTGLVDIEAREATSLHRFDNMDVAGTGHVLEMESIELRHEVLGAIPGAKAELSIADIARVIAALEGLDAEGRAAIGRAVQRIGSEGRDEVLASLSDDLSDRTRKLLDAVVRRDVQ